jgi:hypothetical protein
MMTTIIDRPQTKLHRFLIMRRGYLFDFTSFGDNVKYNNDKAVPEIKDSKRKVSGFKSVAKTDIAKNIQAA